MKDDNGGLANTVKNLIARLEELYEMLSLPVNDEEILLSMVILRTDLTLRASELEKLQYSSYRQTVAELQPSEAAVLKGVHKELSEWTVTALAKLDGLLVKFRGTGDVPK